MFRGLSTGYEKASTACAEELTDLVLSAIQSEEAIELEDIEVANAIKIFGHLMG